FFQAEDGIRDSSVTGVQTCALPISEQNARLVRNAEEYYRAMFGGRVESWNLRDTHMMETLHALVDHVRRTSHHARVVVWAHNSRSEERRVGKEVQSREIADEENRRR